MPDRCIDIKSGRGSDMAQAWGRGDCCMQAPPWLWSFLGIPTVSCFTYRCCQFSGELFVESKQEMISFSSLWGNKTQGIKIYE